MEINVTHLLTSDADLSDFSCSRAERGAYAGPGSWRASLADAANRPLVPADSIQEAKDYFKGFGAWDDDERAAWSDEEVNALVLQYISGDIRETRSCCPSDRRGHYGINWRDYERQSSAGHISSGLYRSGKDVFYSLCN